MDLKVVMTDDQLQPGVTYKPCGGCKVFFPDTAGGFNRHWTKAKCAIVCDTLKDNKKCGAVFGDRLDYNGHHRRQHGTHAPPAKIYLSTLRLCNPRWCEPNFGLDIYKMPLAGTVPADDVPDDPEPDLVLDLAPSADVIMADDSSTGDDNPLLLPVLTGEATTLGELPLIPNLRVVVDNTLAPASVSTSGSHHREHSQPVSRAGRDASGTSTVSPSLSTIYSGMAATKATGA